MKGVLLAGGAGTRLHPVTYVLSKQLLPIYDKPLVYYPLSTLMLAGIREILVIATPQDVSAFERLLGSGDRFGLQLSYTTQAHPEGIAQALIIAAEFIGSDSVALALGDNIFYGHGLSNYLRQGAARKRGATILAYQVRDPQRYGVIEFDQTREPVAIVEKPQAPSSRWAVTGMYFYDNDVVGFARKLRPSTRGELEITDINSAYLERKQLHVIRLGRGIAWLDTGTHESLLSAASFIQTIEERQGLKVACLEEIAYREGWIDAATVLQSASTMAKSSYGQYLRRVVEDET